MSAVVEAPQSLRNRVLLVEDDPGQLRTLTAILEDEGLETQGSATAEEGLACVRPGRFAVAIVDLKLPDMDGNAVLARLRTLDPRIRVILHTAFGSFGSAKEAVNQGAFAYVEKLIDPGELIRQVHRAVAEWATRNASDLLVQVHQGRKMQAIGQFAGGVAHDFNNLLTIINGYCDLLLERLPPFDPNVPLVAEIKKAGERSADLTRQLLAFGRRQVLAPRVVDLNAIVAGSEKMLRRVVGEGIFLTLALAPELDPVLADPGQMEQVLLNLVVNARDAMPHGGRLTLETRNVELDSGILLTRPDVRPGHYVLLAVTDTGCGMTPEVQSRIFEPFFTTKGVGKGTGLGLPTVHGIVTQSDGFVSAYSEVGAGTCMKIYLPRTVAPESAVHAGDGVFVPPRGRETILLVEDEEAVRSLTGFVLTNCGYRVLEAADGAAALQLAAEHPEPIHLLVTDVVMPGLNGRAVAERIAASRPETRILFVSGYTDDAVVRHGVLADGVNFLQKPYSTQGLAAKVRAVLDAPRP